MKAEEFDKYEFHLRKMMIEHLNEHHCNTQDHMRSEIMDRYFALKYRTTAVRWNFVQLCSTIGHVLIEVGQVKDRTEIQGMLSGYLENISFCVDDIVFNLVSMLDYLASLISVLVTGNRSEVWKWNKLNNSLKNDVREFPNTSALITTAHKDWVNRLADYRGDLYHKRNDSNTAEHWFDFETGNENIRFYMPSGMVRQLPFFEKGKDVALVNGTEKLIHYCYMFQRKLLEECYSERTQYLRRKT